MSKDLTDFKVVSPWNSSISMVNETPLWGSPTRIATSGICKTKRRASSAEYLEGDAIL